MSGLRDTFPALEALFRELPPVPCAGCGECCVTPHLTLVEFAYLLDWMLAAFPVDKMIALLTAPMVAAGRFEGNFLCHLQDQQGRCRVYPARSLSCRLEGLPVIDVMSNRRQPLCEQMRTEKEGWGHEVTEALVTGWIDRLFNLCTPFHDFYAEPYFLMSLNIPCWFSVALDPHIHQPFFLRLRDRLRREYDLSYLEPYYQDHTCLAKCLDLIDDFFIMNRQNHPIQALQAIRQVVSDFPQTGTYYKHEGQHFLEEWQKIVGEDNRP